MCISLTVLFLKCFSDDKILPVANEEAMKIIGVKRKHATCRLLEIECFHLYSLFIFTNRVSSVV
jgi:hypothetical protein